MQALIDAPSVVIDELHAVLDTAMALPFSCLPQAALADLVCDLQRVRSRVDAIMCTSTAEAQMAGAASVGGQRTVPALVGARTGVDPAVVGSDQAVGRWLMTFDDFGAAFIAGDLSRRHVQLLKAKDSSRTRAALLASQAFFIEQAQTLDWRDFCIAVDYWVLAADPDGDEPRRQHAARRLTLGRTPDGMAKGAFELDPLAGAALRTALDREVGRQIRSEQAAGSEDTTTSLTQRYADALVNLVARGTDTNMRTPRPLIHISMSPAVAADMLIRKAFEDDDGVTHYPLPGEINPDRLPLSFTDIDGRCELADGTPIHPRLALAAMATAELRRLVMDAASEILDLGTSVRTFPKQLKEALMVAARGRCDEAGCDAPATWLEADHYLPWSRGGRTSTQNGRAKCRPHNQAKGNDPPP